MQIIFKRGLKRAVIIAHWSRHVLDKAHRSGLSQFDLYLLEELLLKVETICKCGSAWIPQTTADHHRSAPITTDHQI